MEKKNYIVGIDVGSSNIVVVVGSKNESGDMVVEALVEKASKGVNAGMVENINQVSECVRAAKMEAEEKLGIRISEAYAGVSGAFIRCASLSDHVYIREPQNGISQSDVDALFLRMKEVVAPENEVIMERIPQRYVVDGNREVADPVGAFSRQLSATFNFILCEKTPLERLNMAFRHSGLQLAGVYANSMIVSESLLSEDERMEGVAVVDIGGSTTDVAVYHGNILRHIATIPMGGSAINGDIKMHGIPERNVESLKRKCGSAIAEFVSEQKLIQIPSMGHRTKGVLRRNLAAIIEARLTDIAEFVKAEIKDSGYAGRLSFGLVLTGGSAAIEHIEELFHRVTGYDVRVATATSGLEEDSRSGIECPEHTAAVSLLLKGAEQGVCAVTPKPMGYVAPEPRTPRPAGYPYTASTPTPTPTATHTPSQMPTPATTPEQNGVGNTPVSDAVAEPNNVTPSATEGEGSSSGSTGSGWGKFGNMLKKLTDGINKTFDRADEDDEII
ncbi:MAG: cell division protein FtsA [Rikenellaceae bacterium]|nr:cell division protein FtsA [Rikenellaceae bacterium]